MEFSLIYLSLGSNLGNRQVNLKKALTELPRKGIDILKNSSIYETEPVEFTKQPNFLNLVCAAQSTLNPQTILNVCHQIESGMGRIHIENKGPRCIDIDILFYGKVILNLPKLKIPHPALHRRNFVLIPLQEIASKFRDPLTGKTVKQLAAESVDQSKVKKWTLLD